MPKILDMPALAHPSESGVGAGMRAYAASKPCNWLTAQFSQYHRTTVLLAQDAAHRDYVAWLAMKELEEERRREQDEAIRKAAKRITFD